MSAVSCLSSDSTSATSQRSKVVSLSTSSAADHPAPGTVAAKALAAQNAGFKALDANRFDEAATDFQSAADDFGRAGDRSSKIDNLVNQATALDLSSRAAEALVPLEDASAVEKDLKDPARRIAILATRGEALAAVGKYDDAASSLAAALAVAVSLGDRHLQAQVLNDIGNLDWARNDFKDSCAHYDRGFQLLGADTDTELEAELAVNAAMSAAKAGDLPQTAQMGAAAVGPLSLLPASAALPLWMELGDAFDKAHASAAITPPTTMPAPVAESDSSSSTPSKDAFLKQCFAAYSRAEELAVEIGDARSEANIYGRLSRVYSAQGRLSDALKLSRRAVSVAEVADLPDVCADWECQTARLLWSSGIENHPVAMESYWNAVDSLGRVVTASQSKNSEFWKENTGICLEAMDRASTLSRDETGDDAQRDRLRILKTADQMKVADIREYFQDECVAAYEPEVSPIKAATAGTAVVYAVPFADRTEIFVAVDGRLSQATTPIGRQQMDAEAATYRRLLETRTTRRFLRSASMLYDQLFRPIEPILASGQIDTIVFLSDGALRSVPIAPLYDGKQFLIEKYAVAVSPAMRLTDYTPPKNRPTRVLAAALAEAKPGLPKLAFVDDELAAIRAAFGVESLENQDFTIARLTDEIQANPYRIVHIASHGVFGSDASETYIATGEETAPADASQPMLVASADRGGTSQPAMPACCASEVGKLTPSDLSKLLGISRFRDQPIELLVLSACDTAVGSSDDQAALGLAGIGIKSGARSTLATLWSINDQASSRFMARFYQALRQEPPLSKAQAVRAAQLSLLTDPTDCRFRHPCYWAPYILAGNWK